MKQLFPSNGNGSMASRRKQIDYLIENRQPFLLAAYPVAARMVNDTHGMTYELVLWQTRHGEESFSPLVMDRVTFEDLVEEYDMTCLAENGYGRIFGIDDTMRQLDGMAREATEKIEKELKDVTLQMSLNGCDIELLKDRKKALNHDLRHQKDTFEKEQSIITFRFKNEDYEA